MTVAQNPEDQQVGTLPAEDSLLADLLISEWGDLDQVWPRGTNQELPELATNETRTITADLLNPIITFSEVDERVRAPKSILPSKLYRTYYETSNTLCCFVSKDTHPKHREEPDLKIADGNGFQSIGTFSLARDLTRPRIERQLVWNKKIEASSFISAFDARSYAERRADFHYEDSQRIGMRVSIAEIETADLIPATVRAHQQTKVEVETKVPLGKEFKTAYKVHKIRIPVWIRSPAKPKDESSITAEQWHSSGTDLWISITEIRQSDFKKVSPRVRKWDTIAAKGHNYEWLAAGFIPKACITKVMPWDGLKLHVKPHDRIVRSVGSVDPWIFDWTTSMWRLDARLYRTGCFLAKYGGTKRKRPADEEDAPDETVAMKDRRVTKKLLIKRQNRPKSKRNTNPYEQTSNPETIKCMSDSTISCTQCGTKKSPFHLEDEIKGPLSYLDLAIPASGLNSSISHYLANSRSGHGLQLHAI
ncbi:hypothetical protein T440DRAFT_480772 [Plenodomus tracheiphilus IPT5]|uniref:Uncharacterized protein n=1 Tax=Plenodomus tracheiphilus IPT5 TaxID=1408161 RepID=A0A6A7B2Z1_9PLEO|nr:hypothetical protein T440DRAFT_480772 [Plenodomus tracheiphilus IPT5]